MTTTPILKSPNQAKISLTMIVRNEEHNLPHCLSSVEGLFDEIVIVDTGSTDRTKEIAEKFGARVFDFPWIDDFSAARNVALEHATGDFAIWLDADDRVEASEKIKLEKLLKQLRPDTNEAYVLKCFCDTSDGAILAVDHPRLFPLRPQIRWIYRIHEQIVPALHATGIPLKWTDIVVRHTGYADAQTHQKKRERDIKLLRREHAERPDDAFVLYYLGTIAFERKQWLEALGYYILSLAKWGTTESIACKLYAMIAWTHQILAHYDESLRVCEEGLFYFPDDAELLFRKAIAHRYRGQTPEAVACWKRILSLKPAEKLYNVDPGIYSHLTRRNLAVIAEELGNRQEAALQLKAILAECPDDTAIAQKLTQMAA